MKTCNLLYSKDIHGYSVLQKLYIKLCYLKLKFAFDTKRVLENNLWIKEKNRKDRITWQERISIDFR